MDTGPPVCRGAGRARGGRGAGRADSPVADQVVDSHFQARGLFENVQVATGKTVTLPALAPRLVDTPGRTVWPGPPLGAHNDEVYRGVLGLDDAEIAALRATGAI